MRHGASRTNTILWVLLVLCVLASAGSLTAYLVLRQGEARNNLDQPMTAWAPVQAAAPRLALRTLAGEPDGAVIDRALAEGETETALVVLAHSVTLSDRNRGGALLRVAAAFAEEEKDDLARALYQTAGELAVLSPDLADWSRAELFMQTGLGLLDLRKPRDRKDAQALFDQARVVIQTSTEMKLAQKQQMAAQLRQAYGRAGMKEADVNALFDSAQADEGRADATGLTMPLGATISMGQDESAEAAVAGDVAPAAVRQAQDVRRQAAQTLVTVLEKQAGAPRPALTADMANALADEEAALAQALQCETCSELLKAEWRTQWAALKWQAARGGFGVSLVTSWEDGLAGIEGEARQSWEALFLARRAEAERKLPAGVSAASLEFSLLRGQLLVGLLGLAPGYDMPAGAARLRELADQEPRDWMIETTGAGAATRFRLRAR